MRFNVYKQGVSPNTISAYRRISDDPNTYGGDGSSWNSLGNMFLSTAQQEQQRQQRVKDLEQEIRYKIAEIDYQRSAERERLAEEQRIAAQSKPQVADDIDEVIANGGELSLYRYLKNRKVKDLSNYKMTLGGKIVYRPNKEQFGTESVDTENVCSNSLFVINDDGSDVVTDYNEQIINSQVKYFKGNHQKQGALDAGFSNDKEREVILSRTEYLESSYIDDVKINLDMLNLARNIDGVEINTPNDREYDVSMTLNKIENISTKGEINKIYIHWTAGTDDQIFDDYQFCITGDGNIHVSGSVLESGGVHTWRRNSNAIGISICCALGASPDSQGLPTGNWQPTATQIESCARLIAVLSGKLNIPIEAEDIMTHSEAADIDGYGPATTCERWDLWKLKDWDGSVKNGGDVLRGKAKWYAWYDKST